jgi:mRNA-degrading endonuclease toxin of MazEF toxin-antitoxin module
VPNHLRVEPDGINGLTEVTYFMVEQLRSIAIERMGRRIGQLTERQMLDLGYVVKLLLSLE